MLSVEIEVFIVAFTTQFVYNVMDIKMERLGVMHG
jgi:hypothetical protein